MRARPLVLAFLAIACAPGSAPASPPPAVTIVEPSGQPAENWHFEPRELRVASGTKVTWTNTGATFHTVTTDDAGKTFDSHVVNPRETFAFTFDKAGTYPYHCDLHPWMKGNVQACDGGCR